MGCAWQTLRSLVAKCFDWLEDDFVSLIKSQRLGGEALGNHMLRVKNIGMSAKECRDYHSLLGFRTFWTQCEKDLFHEGYIEYIMSRGLPFLCRLLKADSREQMRIVLANQRRGRQPLFSKAFGCWQRRAQFRHDQWPFDFDPLQSDTTLDEPNAGYRWASFAQAMRPINGVKYVCRLRGGLRYTGYALWDETRLMRAGILIRS